MGLLIMVGVGMLRVNNIQAESDMSTQSRARSMGLRQATISSPYWYIDLNDAGYSDWMIQTYPGQEPHENLSGEWAAAIRYDGIATPNGESMWLTPYFICWKCQPKIDHPEPCV